MTPDTLQSIRTRQGARIKARRLTLGMTQSDLGNAAGVTKAAVREWEIGKSSPRAHLQVAVAAALHMTHADLFGLDCEDLAATSPPS